MKQTQKQFVIDRLLKDSCISRNTCLQNFISRLSAIIQNLENEGWVFEPEHDKGDYVYYVRKTPYKKVEYFIPELNKTITKYLS